MNAKTEVDRDRSASLPTTPRLDGEAPGQPHTSAAKTDRAPAPGPDCERLSPDPLVQTDRYRLVTPYSLRW